MGLEDLDLWRRKKESGAKPVLLLMLVTVIRLAHCDQKCGQFCWHKCPLVRDKCSPREILPSPVSDVHVLRKLERGVKVINF